ncbi:cytochrome p450 [Senna tora]|uniref:Cytochrome p450 n=1 Tax=Senna tora TaxID=362788 RepID=A0A834T089_9FABA|nr:cytochrome p450 [Senna tora]
MSKFSTAVKVDGRINFGLWQVHVKDEELDLGAPSAIRLCLTKNVLTNVQGIPSKELWKKLEGLYQAKDISNRLMLKEQFHTLHMDEGTKMSDHLSTLNGIVSEIEVIEVKINDEDKALRLIWSLPSSYEYMKQILMYGKDTLNFKKLVGRMILFEDWVEHPHGISALPWKILGLRAMIVGVDNEADDVLIFNHGGDLLGYCLKISHTLSKFKRWSGYQGLCFNLHKVNTL